MNRTPCGATLRNGGSCGHAAMKGQARCRMHGGKTPAALQAAAKRVEITKVRASVTALLSREIPADVDPRAELLRQIGLSVAAERILHGLLDAREQALVDDAPGDAIVVQWSKALGERPSAIWEMWCAERDRAFAMSERALKLGIEMARVQIAREQADVFVRVLNEAIASCKVDGEVAAQLRTAIAARVRALA